MSENAKKVYEYCAADDLIIPYIWRCAFLAKICGVRIPDDTEVVCMNEQEKNAVSSEPYSNALAHLLILFGAGYIRFEQMASLARDAKKYEDEILSAESFVIEQSGKDEKEQVSREYIENILLCTIESRKHSEIQTVNFEMARSLCEGPYTTIRNGFVYVKDVAFLTVLANVKEPMGGIRGGTVEVFPSERNTGDINQKKIDEELNKGNINELPDILFLVNLKNAYYIQQIYSKPYSVEFITYAKAEGILFDENFSRKYDEYVLNNKLKITVSAISRKRNICGDDVNWFDYGTTKYLDKQIIIDDKYDVTKEISLADVGKKEQLDDEVLINTAMDRFISESETADKTVIEVTFCGKKYVYLYDEKNGRKILLDNDKFRRIPFDYNNVWTTVMEWSRSKIIQKKGDCIIVPDSEMTKIAESDRKYAQRMIEEQYSLKKNGNRMLQKLSELKSYAKSEMDFKEQQAKFKASRETGVQEDKKNESVNS